MNLAEQELTLIINLITTIIGGIIGGYASLYLYKRKEKKEKEEKRLNELHSLIILTNPLVITASNTVVQMDEEGFLSNDSINELEVFFNNNLYDYNITSPFHAVHVDKETYSETAEFIEFLQKIQSEIIQMKYKYKYNNDLFDLYFQTFKKIKQKGNILLKLYSNKQSYYLIEYGNKNVKK